MSDDRKILKFIRDVFDFSNKLQRNAEQVARLEKRVDELSDVVKYLAVDNQHLREYIELKLQAEAKDRANDLLRLKVEMLESGRALPPSTPPREDDAK